MSRTIIHVDLDAFFCAIEERRDPALRGQPFAVGGQPDKRGVVASCSYAARRFGVRSAMSMARALTLCPQLRIVPTRHSEYRAASEEVMARLRAVTPLVEQISIDEAFLDVTDMLGPRYPRRSGRSIARYVQKQILEELGLSCSVGVASNKMVAKIATDFGKSTVDTKLSPQAICVVPPGEEDVFLSQLPVNALWGVGPKMEAQLKALGIETIGAIAERPVAELVRRFGKHGYELSQHALGIDKREIVTHRETKSVSTETTFLRDIDDWDELYQVLCDQTVEVASQLRRYELQGTTVRIKLRWSDFTTPTRQSTLPVPTNDEVQILEAATALLRQLWVDGESVRLLGVGVAGFDHGYQLRFWKDDSFIYDDDVDETPARQAEPGSARHPHEQPGDDGDDELFIESEPPAAVPEDGYRLVPDIPKMEPLTKAEKLARAREAMAEIRQRYGDGMVRQGVGK